MNKRRVLITGATGFTGNFVVQEFARYDYDIRLFVRDREKAVGQNIEKFANEIYIGSFENQDSLQDALENVDVLINIASLGFGHTPGIIKACKEAKCRRAVFISTTGIFTKLNPSSKTIRLEAEKLIRESGIDYTILRPTMIFGTGKDRNISRLINFINKYGFLFIPGSGDHLLQPVFVKDLACAVRLAAEAQKAINKAYNISGSEAVTFNYLADTVASLLGKKLLKIHVPLEIGVIPLRIIEKCGFRLPIRAEQLLRLNENKNFSFEDAAQDLGYSPVALTDALTDEIHNIYDNL
jgi:nucleoside-diphosphate-sugar epimerase